mgnify:CR=1 FL=1
MPDPALREKTRARLRLARQGGTPSARPRVALGGGLEEGLTGAFQFLKGAGLAAWEDAGHGSFRPGPIEEPAPDRRAAGVPREQSGRAQEADGAQAQEREGAQMRFAPPRRFRLCGQTWKVKDSATLAAGAGHYGETHYFKREILLESEMDAEQRSRSFLHEAIHATSDTYHLGLTERQVKCLAHGVDEVLQQVRPADAKSKH